MCQNDNCCDLRFYVDVDGCDSSGFMCLCLLLLHEREPDKVVARLEKIYAISFPDSIKELRTARTGVQWDGCVNFVIKFAAEPNVVDSFLNIKHLEPYSPDRDGRKEKGAVHKSPALGNKL